MVVEQVRDMVGLGLGMNAIGVLAILVAMHTLGVPLFQLGGEEVPEEWGRCVPGE